MVNNISVFTAGFIIFILIMLGVGYLLSASMSGTDLVNFLRNGAEAEQMRAETQYQTEVREMEMPYLDAERAAWSEVEVAEAEQQAALVTADTERRVKLIGAQTIADIASIEEGLRYEKEQHDRQLAQNAQWMGILILTAKLFILIFTAVLAYFLLRTVHKLTGLPGTQRADYSAGPAPDIWSDRNYKEREIQRARQLEQLNRMRAFDLVNKNASENDVEKNEQLDGKA